MYVIRNDSMQYINIYSNIYDLYPCGALLVARNPSTSGRRRLAALVAGPAVSGRPRGDSCGSEGNVAVY